MRTHLPFVSAKALALISAGAVMMPLTVSSIAHAQTPPEIAEAVNDLYIVQLVEPPLATYDGGVEGLGATKPGTGDKVDAESDEAAEYADHVTDQQDLALDDVGVSGNDVVYRYDTAINAMAVELDADEATEIARAPGVRNVWPNEIFTADTVTTPDYLGLSGSDGVWQEQFGGVSKAGKGVVVGVIDSGIWPESASFAPLDGGGLPPAWKGECVTGEESDAADNITCNSKLIGARYYDAGLTLPDYEVESPRDVDGHGTHIAGTAAGNEAVPMSVRGAQLGQGSGMAPAAHIAAYKALWATDQDQAYGSTVDILAAIEDAVSDGVDVINFSASGSSDSVVEPVQSAFYSAAVAGIVVSTPAGNSADAGPGTVQHNSPWVMTVAASTHTRNVAKTLTLGDASTYKGVGGGPGLSAAPLVYAGDIPAPGVDPLDAALCAPDLDSGTAGVQPSVDSDGAEGAIVVCDRTGDIDRVATSRAVDEAGGVGMVLANVTPEQSVDADFHSVPTIHVDSESATSIREYVDTADSPTAAIGEPEAGAAIAPEMAGFSSDGPAVAGGGDLLKPDITAPGVDIIAATSPAASNEDFESLTGTSMSAPHIAGLAALMKQAHPQWSAAAIKSAMMTTARTQNSDGGPIQRTGSDATALDYGSGEVVPASAYSPGLVYDADESDWFGYACSLNQLQPQLADPAGCDGYDTDPSDLNYPTIAIGDFAVKQTVTRTVTNVTDTDAEYTAEVAAPDGVSVSVEPSTLEVPAGGKATFTVTFTQQDALTDAYTFGSLTWDGPTRVASAIALQPSLVSAPEEFSERGSDDAKDFSIIAGFGGTLDLDVDGLLPATVTDVKAKNGPSRQDGTLEVEVPEGTTVLRASTFADEVDAADIDLWAYDPDNQLVAASVQEGSTEEMTLVDPAPGTWTIAVDMYSEEPTADVPLSTFVLSDTAEGNMTLAPDSVSVEPGDRVDVTAAWSDLGPTGRYLGAINYRLDGVTQDRTLVTIDNGTASVKEVERIGGLDRFDTAALIAAQYPGPVDTVYVANGYTFADALSGAAPAAGTKVPSSLRANTSAAPVLLTKSNVVPPATAAALTGLGPKQIVILGGKEAVDPAVEKALKAYGDVERVGGTDRYDTSARLATLYNKKAPVVYVASGADANFPDALSGGALAGSQDAPVLLVRPDRIDDVTQSALDHLNADQIVVLGGENAVSGQVYDAMGADRRLSGANRFATSAAIAAEFDSPADGALVASGRGWPDALAGSALAGFLDQPILLSDTSDVPDVVMSQLDELSPGTVVLLGGKRALTQDVEDELNAAYPVWSR